MYHKASSEGKVQKKDDSREDGSDAWRVMFHGRPEREHEDAPRQHRAHHHQHPLEPHNVHHPQDLHIRLYILVHCYGPCFNIQGDEPLSKCCTNIDTLLPYLRHLNTIDLYDMTWRNNMTLAPNPDAS